MKSDFAPRNALDFGCGGFGAACIGLIAFLSFAAYSFLKANISGALKIAYGGIGPTEVRCTIILINLMLYWHHPDVFTTPVGMLSSIDLVLLCLSAIALLTLLVTALRDIRALARENS